MSGSKQDQDIQFAVWGKLEDDVRNMINMKYSELII